MCPLRHLLFLLLLGSLPALAGTPATAVSIKPLALLYQALLPEAPAPAVLLPSGQNLHDYALTVEDLRLLQQSHVLLWVGDGNERFLSQLEKRFAGSHQWYALAPGSDHAWLDLDQLPTLINAMAQVLQQQPAADVAAIEQQRLLLLKALVDFRQHWQQQLADYRHSPFVLGHDAFLAFSRQLGLHGAVLYQAGHSHGHRHGGTRDLLAIQQRLASGEIRCLLEEPDISFAQLARRYPHSRRLMLEPMAASQSELLPFLEHSAATLLDCLRLE